MSSPPEVENRTAGLHQFELFPYKNEDWAADSRPMVHLSAVIHAHCPAVLADARMALTTTETESMLANVARVTRHPRATAVFATRPSKSLLASRYRGGQTQIRTRGARRASAVAPGLSLSHRSDSLEAFRPERRRSRREFLDIPLPEKGIPPIFLK
jgi:hypothetical protein